MVPKEKEEKKRIEGGKVTGDRGMESGIGGWRVVELLHALIKSFSRKRHFGRFH